MTTSRHQRKYPNEPYDVTKRARHRHQCESASYITLIRKFCYHTLDDSEVPIHYTVKEAAIVLRYKYIANDQPFYTTGKGKNLYLRMRAQRERERPKRTVETTEPKRLIKRIGLRPM
jgi:hypothetical protein